MRFIRTTPERLPGVSVSSAASPLAAASWSFDTLCRASAARLEEAMQAGVTPAESSLAGWEFRGYNTGRLTDLLGIRKFKKGFYFAPPESSQLWGYNVRVRQDGLGHPWIPVRERGLPLRHGLYEVRRAGDSDRVGRYPQALVLDYGRGRNPLLDPSRVLRDYLVQVSGDDGDLMLGKAYLALGPLRVAAGYFVLERHALQAA